MMTLFSNNSALALTPDGLRKLTQFGGHRPVVPVAAGFKVHRLADRLSAGVVEEIVRRYQAGESATSLAKELGVAPSGLLNLMRERQVVVRKHGVTAERAAVLAKEYEAGATVAELEGKYGMSHSTVLRALKSSGASMRPTGRRPSQ